MMWDEWVAFSKVYVWPRDPLSKCPRTNPLLDSCGLVPAEATGEHREGKFPFNWRPATVLGCNDFTSVFLSGVHIFKSCYGSSMGLFSPLDCAGKHRYWFVWLCSTHHVSYALTSSCIMCGFCFFPPNVSLDEEGSLWSKRWENYRRRSEH